MTMPYDGRSRPTPVYAEGALAPEEFQREYVDALMGAWIEHVPAVGPPPGMAPEQARRFHGTYLKYFSFFAWRFPSWLLAVATQCPYQEIRKEIIEDCVDEEVGDPDADGFCHIDVLYEEAEACGISKQEIYDAEPTPEILTAALAFENLSRTLGWLPGFAAVAALEISHSEPAMEARARLTGADQAKAYGQELGGSTFHERLGLPEGALKFFALHSYKDRFHGGGELALLVKYANTRSLQLESLWAARASVQVLGVMSREIIRLCYEAVGTEVDERRLSQVAG
jgi:pyrroloquinoline quinone (PQQ) biosynthesis protein C